MDDDEEYVIGVANDWEMGRMEERIQWSKSCVYVGIKEEKPHRFPALYAHSNGKISLNRLLKMDAKAWISWKDSEANKLNELEGEPYGLRFQIIAYPRQKLYGPGVHEDGTVLWH